MSAAVAVTVFGHRVRQARTIRKVSIKTLREMLNFSPVEWTRLEQAVITELPSAVLLSLARFLEFPAPFFERPPGRVVNPDGILLRARANISKAEMDALAANIELHDELLDGLHRLASSPPLRLPWGTPPNLSIPEAAKAVRRSFGLSETEPVAHVLNVMELAGIPVVPANFDLADVRHDAYTFWVGEFSERPIVFLRPTDSWERTRWSAAHELGHLVMHRLRTRGEPELEDQANQFANEFLLPGDMLRLEWPRVVTLGSLQELKTRWRISLAALIQHGRANGLLERDRVAGLFKQLSARRDPVTREPWLRREPGWSSELRERPMLLAAMYEAGTGSAASPAGLAEVAGGWPADVLTGFAAPQSAAPSKNQQPDLATSADYVSNVLAFERRR